VSITIEALLGIGRVEPGDDLARLLAPPLVAIASPIRDDDVLVVCQKIVSKAEGRVVDLATVRPSVRAEEFAQSYGKDAALVELALREATEVLRMENGHLITATGPGFICANSGIDRSNQNRDGEATLLPLDADDSARRLRARLAEISGVEIAIVISDTFGRPWRLGQLDVAIGSAGLEVLDDHVGRSDWGGRRLEHTLIAVADQIAAAAGLVMGKADGVPAVLVRGYPYRRAAAAGAAALVRPRSEDIFR
jgi:coenzyme F420-0:L-glutamate ligase/coenzyme F420-1:gamma-L-glutamate ligase